MATPATAPAVDLEEVARALADLLEERSRDLARAQNANLLDAHKVVELARRTVRGPITQGHVREWWGAHVHEYGDGNQHLAQMDFKLESQILDCVKHFGGLMAQ